MARTRAEVKAELEAQAAKLIEEALAWDDQTEAPSLMEIEDQVLKFRKRFGEKLAEALAERQASVEPLTVRCPTCQRPMHRKRRRQRRSVESRVGQVPLARAYYYCEHCRRGLFPPGSPVAGRGTTVE
jgi:uncharacterized protein with PIN domain